MRRRHFYDRTAVVVAAAMCGGILHAKQKNRGSGSDQRPDEIIIEAHLAAIQVPITRLVAARRYDRSYIYAERGPGKGMTLIDVTDPGHLFVRAEISAFSDTTSDSLLAVAGTAVIVGSGPSASAVQAQTVRIMNFSDPDHPRISRQFEDVTAVEQGPGGEFIFLANAEGVWILRKHLASDPESEKRDARKVVYGESMYP